MSTLLPEPTAGLSVPAAGTGETPTGVPSPPAGYRAHLDGLRAVAVYLVVLFHAGIQRFSGGFIGVDVFFVLSGYLVTQVLMRDLAGGGRVRFARFYARRFRRLLPASAMALVGTAIAYSWVASPVEVDGAIDGFRASFLYVANWFFIRESADYFAAGQSDSPVLHFWSLAVEEQFYLVWPVLLAGLAAVAGRTGRVRWSLVRAAVAVAAVASLVWAWHLSGGSPDRAYYGTDTRAYQLLAGALLAMTPSILVRLRRLEPVVAPVALLSLAGLVLASTDAVSARPVARGIAATVLTLLLIVTVERGGGLTRSFLSWGPVVELGRISYGTYLWHWPVIVVVGRLGDFTAVQMAAIAVVASSAMAALSATMVEQPLRRTGSLDRLPRLVVSWGLLVSLLMGLVLIRPIAELWDRPRATPAAAPEDGEALTPLPDDFDEAAIRAEGFAVDLACEPTTGEGCDLVRGDGPHVLLVGDSNALMLVEALTAVAEAEDLSLTVAVDPGCAWQAGYFYVSHPDKREHCEQIQRRVYEEVLDDLRPDVVIAVGVREWSTFSNPDFTDTEQERSLRSTTLDSVERMLDTGARVVVIEPLPRGTRNPHPLNCLGVATYQEECRFSSPAEPFWLEVDLRSLDAAHDRLWSIDLDRLVCPALPSCEAMLDDVVVHWDDAHLTRRFARSLADPIAAELRSRGLLER